MYKPLLILLGFVCLALGTAGIILPGLPTTPFVLLAAGLFLKSSDKLYRKLLRHPLYGKILQRAMEKRGMTLRMKIMTLLLMTAMITCSMFILNSPVARGILAVLGLIGAFVMIFIIPRVDE